MSLPFTVLDASGNTLPSGWSHGDIGAVAAAGSASFDGSVWTVTGSGADIWNTADEFHFAYRAQPTAFEIETRVESVQNVHPWTKAGLMVRTERHRERAARVDLRHARARASRSSGARAAGGDQPGDDARRHQRAGVAAADRLERRHPRLLQEEPDRPLDAGRPGHARRTTRTANVGLAVTSHADGTLATATFSKLRSGALPDWVGARAIGSNTASVVYDGTDYALTARGPGHLGRRRCVRLFLDRQPPPNRRTSTIIARVVSIDNTHEWAKSGLMFRESLAPGSKHVFVMVTPGKGVSLQYRAQTSGQSAVAASVAGVAPRWLKLQRSGNTFTASYSIDGVTFVQFGTVTVELVDALSRSAWPTPLTTTRSRAPRASTTCS